MRSIVTPDQMRELDRRTIEDLGMPGMVLMELAARGVMLEVEALLGGRVPGSKVLVFCGGGNNGGDGFAVARRLMNMNADPTVYLLAERSSLKGDALLNLEIYERLNGEVIEINDASQLAAISPEADVIVDALLGTGLRGAVDGNMAKAIDVINNHMAPVVSVDIPSGVDGGTGYIDGSAVQATTTATFGEIKAGLIMSPGLENAGRISRVDIQIPPTYAMEVDAHLYLIEPQDVFEMLPVRGRDAHKGDAGKVLVVAGSVGMSGAAQLAAKASLRAGAGLVKVATAAHAQEAVAGGDAEIMTIPLPDTAEGTIAPEADLTVQEAGAWADIEIIGPGLSLNEQTVEWVLGHVENLKKPTVIDADALNAIASKPELIANLSPDTVLTPHVGEFARMTGLSSDEIARDRINLVRKFATEWGLTLLLKGVPSIICGPRGTVYAVLAGNPGMATAGMGDVLTGTIGAMMAQGLDPVDATICATSVHGIAGDLASEEVGGHGMVASDVVERLPLAQDIAAGRAAWPKSHGGCSCGSGGTGCGGDCNCGEGGGGGGCGDGSCGC